MLNHGPKQRRFIALGGFLLGLSLVLASCDTHCRDTDNEPSLVGPSEYLLTVSNGSGHMVALEVDGEDQGSFCAGVSHLVVGAFPRNACSQITVLFLDNPGELHLDDCDQNVLGGCESNNVDGVCYDTRNVNVVEAAVD